MAQNPKQSGLITKTLQWVLHPLNADTDPMDWFAFLVLAVIISIFWSRVLRQIVEAA